MRGWLVALGLLSSSCVAKDAGYSDVRQLVAERSGHETRWHAFESSESLSEDVRKLLSAPLDVDAVVKVALLNNPDLQATYEELGISRARLRHALRLPNPHAEAGFTFSGADAGPDIELSLTESLSQLFFMAPRKKAARADLDATVIDVAGAALDVAFQTRIAFYDYLAAERILELRRTVLEAAAASFDASKRLFDAGNITPLAMANDRALYEETRLATVQSEAHRVAARQRLDAWMGLWGHQTHWTTAGPLPELPSEAVPTSTLESRAVARSLELEGFRRRFEAAARRARLARIEGAVPDIEAGILAEREDDEWELGPVVELEIPLFYQGQGRVDEARAEMRREQRRYAAHAIRLRGAARSAAARVALARERTRFFERTLLPLREEILGETLREYNAMTIGVFQLLQAKRDQVEAARAHVEALHDYWVARTEVDQLLAGRLVPIAGAPAAAAASTPAPRGTRDAH